VPHPFGSDYATVTVGNPTTRAAETVAGCVTVAVRSGLTRAANYGHTTAVCHPVEQARNVQGAEGVGVNGSDGAVVVGRGDRDLAKLCVGVLRRCHVFIIARRSTLASQYQTNIKISLDFFLTLNQARPPDMQYFTRRAWSR
jgi:hypothetical protein